MLSNELWRPFLRLATAVVFMVAVLLVQDLKADLDTCSEAEAWCASHDEELVYDWCSPWPDNYTCWTCAYHCPYGPYYSGCDVCYA